MQPAVRHGDVVAGMYTIRDVIVETDQSVVYEARDMMLDRLVAVKIARPFATMSMILEARRCATVRDPCAVSIFAMGRHEGAEFVVSERVTGRLLREVLEMSAVLTAEQYLTRLRSIYAAVARAHDAGVAIGELSGATMSVTTDERLILGRLSLSQVPAFGPLGSVRAPEVIRGEVEENDPNAAEGIDLYGMGCIAFELARGAAPFSGDGPDAELTGHASRPPPRLTDLRPDLPVDLSDLVEWLLAKNPHARPTSAQEVLDQLDAIIARLGARTRNIRVLIVDDDTARARWLWSLARRAYASAQVEVASEGTDAAHKLNRDHPDLVLIDAQLRGVMNALELCMYARGLDSEIGQLALVGDVSEKDRLLFDDSVKFLRDDANLANTVLEVVRSVAAQPARRRKARITVSG